MSRSIRHAQNQVESTETTARVTGPGRAARVVAATALVAIVAAATGGSALHNGAAQEALEQARGRVDQQLTADLAAQEQVVFDTQRAALATALAARDAQRAEVVEAVRAAVATLAASPNADAAHRAALQHAIDAAQAATASGAVSLATMQAAVAALDGPATSVTVSQAAWVQAEQAKELAAAKAAATKAAAAKAAASKATASTAKKAAKTSTKAATTKATAKKATTKKATTKSTGKAAAKVNGVPKGGLVCKGTGGSPASESSYASLGAAINAYRASIGLPQLKVVRSAGLVGHAKTMGVTGGIWHSGADNIVGCVSNGSNASLVKAWSKSASHDKQMRRTDVSRMEVGGALENGWLFGAVLFR